MSVDLISSAVPNCPNFKRSTETSLLQDWTKSFVLESTTQGASIPTDCEPWPGATKANNWAPHK